MVQDETRVIPTGREKHEPVRREGNSKERVKKGLQINFISANGALHKAYCSVQSRTVEKEKKYMKPKDRFNSLMSKSPQPWTK